MKEKLETRTSVPSDHPTIELLYPAAFPDEDLLPLVKDLLPDTAVTTSLVALLGHQIVGHVIFTTCGVAEEHSGVALLGPLAVDPAWQGQGIGSAVVNTGLQWLKGTSVRLVCVLGDPAFYSRLGFLPESSIRPPYRLPAEWDGAWQSLDINPVGPPLAGTLSVPRQWRQPALWAP